VRVREGTRAHRTSGREGIRPDRPRHERDGHGAPIHAEPWRRCAWDETLRRHDGSSTVLTRPLGVLFGGWWTHPGLRRSARPAHGGSQWRRGDAV